MAIGRNSDLTAIGTTTIITTPTIMQGVFVRETFLKNIKYIKLKEAFFNLLFYFIIV
jgi:hypothetical protein